LTACLNRIVKSYLEGDAKNGRVFDKIHDYIFHREQPDRHQQDHTMLKKGLSTCIQITASCLWEGSCPVYVICVCVCIVVSNTYCVVFLLCFSSSCVPYVASFSGLCIPRTHICMIVHFPPVLGTDTSIKSVRINLGSYSHPIVVNWRGYVSVPSHTFV
jgi:hypothetical protein